MEGFLTVKLTKSHWQKHCLTEMSEFHRGLAIFIIIFIAIIVDFEKVRQIEVDKFCQKYQVLSGDKIIF